MRVLVFTPLHPDYGIRPLSLQSIMNQQYDAPFDRVFAANDNPVESWHKGAANRNIMHNYNNAMEMAASGAYDAMLTVEADMIIPPDALQSLVDAMQEHDAGVVYGLYVFRQLKQLNITHRIGKYGREQTTQAFMSKHWGEVVESAGLGLGCTLIRRDVINRYMFRLYDGAPGMLACDWRFAVDCQELGIRQFTHLGVQCGHITNEGGILWPQENEPLYYDANDFNDHAVVYAGNNGELNYGY